MQKVLAKKYLIKGAVIGLGFSGVLVLGMAGCATRLSSESVESGSPEEVPVGGTLTASYPYCGGAYPGEAEIRRIQAERPLQTVLYVFEGAKYTSGARCVDSCTTDSEGRFRLSLAPGEYVLLLPEQKSDRHFKALEESGNSELSADRACLKAWREGGLFQLSLEAGKPQLDLNAHLRHACFVPYPPHCFEYSGPYPP